MAGCCCRNASSSKAPTYEAFKGGSSSSLLLLLAQPHLSYSQCSIYQYVNYSPPSLPLLLATYRTHSVERLLAQLVIGNGECRRVGYRLTVEKSNRRRTSENVRGMRNEIYWEYFYWKILLWRSIGPISFLCHPRCRIIPVVTCCRCHWLVRR